MYLREGGLSSRWNAVASGASWRLTRVNDAVGDSCRNDVAFAGTDVGLGENVAVGRAQLDPAVGAHEYMYEYYFSY